MSTVNITKECFLHYTFEGVDPDSRDTPERKIEVLALQRDCTGDWGTYWKVNHGQLLKVVKVTEIITMEDPVQATITKLEEEITDIQAKAAMEVKTRRDRINDLLMIGYDSGSAQVVDVEVKEPSDDNFF